MIVSFSKKCLKVIVLSDHREQLHHIFTYFTQFSVRLSSPLGDISWFGFPFPCKSAPQRVPVCPLKLRGLCIVKFPVSQTVYGICLPPFAPNVLWSLILHNSHSVAGHSSYFLFAIGLEVGRVLSPHSQRFHSPVPSPSLKNPPPSDHATFFHSQSS